MSTESLFSRPLLVLDTETTGLPKHPHATVIEIGAVLISRSGFEVASCGALIRCELPLPPEADYAMQINGIDPAHLGEAGCDLMAGRMLWGIIKHVDPVITAFNIGFDRAMIEKADLRFGSSTRWGKCIMVAAKDAMGVRKLPKLSEAAEYFEVTVDGPAHRAITDARTAAGVAIAMARAGNPVA